ncbi:MAG: pyridoxal phosphate-dependent decarboxylase family protein, partial [Anaerolineae bacterium]
MADNPYRLPEKGIPKDEVLAAMRALREKDVKWQDGRLFSLIYYAGEEITDVLKEAALLFFSENGLNPSVFPSLRQMETEVVAISADLLGGDAQTVGNMTSGGTESILLAVKTAREWARAHRPDIRQPEMILPLTAHPAFEKAAHYFDVKPVRTAIGPDFRADVEAARAAITPRTILMVGSAPAYPFGVVDPIAEMAAIAQERGILFHVDACVGGFMLPFVRKLGYPVPDFDFRVPGVTSISADLHKYGYCVKGASVILYRDAALRRHQFFAYTDWPGG